MKETEAEKLRNLRKLVREFLHTIKDVPFRSIDCDQNSAEWLYLKLARASGYKG